MPVPWGYRSGIGGQVNLPLPTREQIKMYVTSPIKERKKMMDMGKFYVRADGSVRLFVIVEAPGYEKWENAIRMKFNSTKPISFPVEMERMAGLQG
jgi:hypothetical protein